MPSSGGLEEQVTGNGGFAAFESPDGRYLYYAKSRSASGLWRKRLPGGAEEVVLEQLKPGYWGYWAVVENGRPMDGCIAFSVCSAQPVGCSSTSWAAGTGQT